MKNYSRYEQAKMWIDTHLLSKMAVQQECTLSEFEQQLIQQSYNMKKLIEKNGEVHRSQDDQRRRCLEFYLCETSPTLKLKTFEIRSGKNYKNTAINLNTCATKTKNFDVMPTCWRTY